MLAGTNGKRHDFTRVLTHDEISGIFMYLTQRDCVQCMQVSQRWRHWVPLYVETTFSHVELDGTRDYRRYHCFIACLGPHTKSLVVKGCSDANALSHLMDLLEERGCQEGIESLEFHKCYVPGDLASRLCQWKHLKYLTLSQMTHIMDTEAFYLSLITRCRSLTALYIECDFMMMCEPSAESIPIVMTTTTTTTNLNMRHLSWKVFGGELEQPRDFQSLLLQCPNLISLEGWLATNFDPKVFEWCPKLQHLRWVGRHPNRHYYQLPRNDQELQALDDQQDVDYHRQLKGLSMQHYDLSTFMNQHRLRYLELDVEQEQQSDAIQLLERNASTLQSLLLEIDGILLPIMACLYEFGIIQRLVSLVLLVRPFNAYEGSRTVNASSTSYVTIN